MGSLADLGFWQNIIGLVFVAAIILVLVAGRVADDSSRTRTLARYLGAILVASLFLMIFSLFGALQAFLNLIVQKPSGNSMGGHAGLGQLEDLLNQIPGLSGSMGGAGGGSNYATPDALYASNDAALRYGLENILIGLASGAVFFYHLARARVAFPIRELRTDASGAVVRTTVYGICFIAAVTVIAAGSRAIYDVFELIFPSTFANAGSESIARERAAIDAFSYIVLALTSVVVFFRSWHWLPRTTK